VLSKPEPGRPQCFGYSSSMQYLMNSQKQYVAANSYTRGVLWPSKYAKMHIRPGLSPGPRRGSLRCFSRPPIRTLPPKYFPLEPPLLLRFLQRIRIAPNADRCNSQMISVYPSVCLSVFRPSHSGVLSRRIKIRSCGFQHQVGISF